MLKFEDIKQGQTIFMFGPITRVVYEFVVVEPPYLGDEWQSGFLSVRSEYFDEDDTISLIRRDEPNLYLTRGEAENA
ncbi:hypothetical protein [Pseudomonas phage Astolliot]|nr:hypothetical protein [Pseudomonas phage Astolliot]